MSGESGFTARTPQSVAMSYSIIVPPGFVRIPGGGDASVSTEALISQLPTGMLSETAATDVRSELAGVFARDKARSVIDSFIIPGLIPGLELACNVVVALIQVPSDRQSKLDVHLLGLVASRGAIAGSIGGDPAVVYDEVMVGEESSPADSPFQVVARRTAVTRMAGVDDHLLTFVLTVGRVKASDDASAQNREDENVVVDALVVLFDSMLASVRWLDERGHFLIPMPEPEASQ